MPAASRRPVVFLEEPMRTTRRARWALFALALSLVIPTQLATADKKKRSVDDCTSFDQKDRDDEEGVDFSIQNSCSMPVACSLQWTVTCAPESKKRKSRKRDSHSFQLDASNGITLTASTARCGDDGWQVDDISWSCAPARD
jgi:hypothetical protein